MPTIDSCSQYISVHEYAISERTHSARLANLEIAAFGPVVFNQLSFPHAVSDEQEIVRYVDSMHEDEAGNYYSSDFQVSEAELGLIEKIRENVRELTCQNFRRPIVPVIAPLGALKMFRVLSEISRLHGNKKLKIVEFGPGSGYLGAMLALCGHQYVSIDIAQAMYLWQNRLYCKLFGDNFTELARDENPISADDKLITHIPWWRLRELYDKPFANTEIIVADRVVSEMSKNAFLFNAALSQRLLGTRTASGGAVSSLIIFDSFGFKRNRPPEVVLSDFEVAGFSTIFHRRLWGVAPIDSALGQIGLPYKKVLGRSLINRISRLRWRNLQAGKFRELALDHHIPVYDPEETGKTVAVREHLAINENELPLDFDFLAAIGVPYPSAVKKKR